MTEYLRLYDKLQGAHLAVQEHEYYILKQFEKFCEQFARFCEEFAYSNHDAMHIFNPQLFSTIAEVNQFVNTTVMAKSDLELYGVREHWTIPDGFGDCEDYVLLKVKLLLQRGLNATRLHILVVDDEYGAGHAVLGIDVFDEARRQWNTIILDNVTPRIIPLNTMEEKYVGKLMSFTSSEGDRLRVRMYRYASAKPLN